MESHMRVTLLLLSTITDVLNKQLLQDAVKSDQDVQNFEVGLYTAVHMRANFYINSYYSIQTTFPFTIVPVNNVLKT